MNKFIWFGAGGLALGFSMAAFPALGRTAPAVFPVSAARQLDCNSMTGTINITGAQPIIECLKTATGSQLNVTTKATPIPTPRHSPASTSSVSSGGSTHVEINDNSSSTESGGSVIINSSQSATSEGSATNHNTSTIHINISNH